MIITIIGLLAISTFGILRLPQFGRKATGTRRSRILNSPNFREGKFQNLSFTPDLNEKYTYWDVFKEFIKKHKDNTPLIPIPSVKTDLHQLDFSKNQIVWFGHSSYLLIFEGKKILVDPVFSGHASPFPIAVAAYKGANDYSTEDMPEVDLLIITHDHYDHLDYKTVMKLKQKAKMVLTSLGVGEHLEKWGFDTKKLIELDWYEKHQLPDLQIISAPTRHFSGRSFSPKTTLWGAFVLKGKNGNIYIGGDSGYDTHFKKTGDEHGPFDLVILDGGQYDDQWKYIHMMPEETAQAAIDLKAKKLFPVHWAKFSMANHPWYEPAVRVTKACEQNNVPYFTTKIGEVNNWEQKVGGEKWWV
ncbi:MAG: MBL fold metallo-hydrolase [Bacteroidota bacterium]